MGYLDNYKGKPAYAVDTNKVISMPSKTKLAFAPKRKKKLAKYTEEEDGKLLSSQADKDAMGRIAKSM